jgi:hypothetical protein
MKLYSLPCLHPIILIFEGIARRSIGMLEVLSTFFFGINRHVQLMPM